MELDPNYSDQSQPKFQHLGWTSNLGQGVNVVREWIKKTLGYAGQVIESKNSSTKVQAPNHLTTRDGVFTKRILCVLMHAGGGVQVPTYHTALVLPVGSTVLTQV